MSEWKWKYSPKRDIPKFVRELKTSSPARNCLCHSTSAVSSCYVPYLTYCMEEHVFFPPAPIENGINSVNC